MNAAHMPTRILVDWMNAVSMRVWAVRLFFECSRNSGVGGTPVVGSFLRGRTWMWKVDSQVGIRVLWAESSTINKERDVREKAGEGANPTA